MHNFFNCLLNTFSKILKTLHNMNKQIRPRRLAVGAVIFAKCQHWQQVQKFKLVSTCGCCVRVWALYFKDVTLRFAWSWRKWIPSKPTHRLPICHRDDQHALNSGCQIPPFCQIAEIWTKCPLTHQLQQYCMLGDNCSVLKSDKVHIGKQKRVGAVFVYQFLSLGTVVSVLCV